MRYVVYRVKNKINGKCYVGYTENFDRRKTCHLSDAKSGLNGSPKFYRALRKYGSENFEWSILSYHRTIKNAKKSEIRWIKKLDSKDNGYNCTDGGEGIESPSLETRNRMSIAKIGKPSWNKGKKWNNEIKNKFSVAHIGKVASRKTKAKMSISNARRNGFNCGQDEESKLVIKNKISLTLRRIPKEVAGLIFKMRSLGNTYSEISKSLDVSKGYVGDILSHRYHFQKEV